MSSAFRFPLRSFLALLFAVPGKGVAAQDSGSRVWPDLEPGPYAVGYTVRHEYDHSRSFRKFLLVNVHLIVFVFIR